MPKAKHETKFRAGDTVRWRRYGITFEVRSAELFKDRVDDEVVWPKDGSQTIHATELELVSRPALPDPHDIEFPEAAKFRAALPDSSVITEFLMWLDEKEIVLAKRAESGWLHTLQTPREEMLMEHFGIDWNKLEDERRAMIRQCQARYAKDELEKARGGA